MFGLRFYLLHYIVFAASKVAACNCQNTSKIILWLIAVSKWASIGDFGTYTGFAQASKVLEYTGLS